MISLIMFIKAQNCMNIRSLPMAAIDAILQGNDDYIVKDDQIVQYTMNGKKT